jgi:uncharacterized protein YggE
VSGITVRGRGVARATPDEATLELALEALRGTPAEALADVGARSEALVTLCDELGIPPERRVTSGATVQEEVDYRDGKQHHRGYRASAKLVVRVDSAELAGRLLAQAVERVEARVAGPWWSVAPGNPARLRACREAAEDARRKAEAYAESLGARLGAIVAAREPGARIGWPEPRLPGVRASVSLSAAPSEDVPVEAGDLEVVAEIEIEWALEQA